MLLTEDQFVEIVVEAIDRHVSRDASVAQADQSWEARNAAKTISRGLRLQGVAVPEVGNAPIKQAEG